MPNTVGADACIGPQAGNARFYKQNAKDNTMHTRKRLTIAYLAMAAALLVLFALNLFWGSVALSPADVVSTLLGRGQDVLTSNILLQLRLPRTVMVVLLGAALSVAGYLLQTFFANPIAGPFVMGISSGAKLAVALTMVVFLNRGLLTSSLVLIAAAFAGAMAAYQMGESYAASVGVSVRSFSVLLVLLSSLLAACVTAFAGPISFVGIAVPHLVKQALGSAKPLHVLPGCALGGASFCLLCDLIARSLFAPTELSISSVTAVFGAPVVIWLLVRRHSGEGTT